MSRRRFYAEPSAFTDSRVSLSAEESHHLKHVLRMKPGDEARVFDGEGREFRCRIASTRGCAALDIMDELKDPVEPPLEITLAQGIAKGDKFDLIIQKATEIGVRRVVPIVGERSDIKLSVPKAGTKVDRWKRIALGAVKQSGRRRLVEVVSPYSVSEFLDSLGGASNQPGSPATRLIFNAEAGLSIHDVLGDSGAAERKHVILLVGPEGGWSHAELSLTFEHGFKPVSLGPRILRTETAALVALALVQHILGDLSM